MVFGVPHQISPFHFIMMAGRHVHHLVFGMLIRLAGGLWLCEFGTAPTPLPCWPAV